MKEKFIMYMAMLWIVGTIMSFIMAGAWIGDNQTETVNRLMVMKVAKVGTWSVPVPNDKFFVGGEDSTGTWRPGGLTVLINWDFGFLQGSVLMWVFYLLNIGLMFIFLGIFVGVIQSVFN